MRTVIAALAMVLAASVANAQQYQPSSGYGLGISTCGEFAEAYRKFDPRLIEDTYFSWAAGYMTGINAAKMFDQSKDVGMFRDLTATSKSDQQALIRRYCNDHPLSKYVDAVMSLYFSLPMATKKR